MTPDDITRAQDILAYVAPRRGLVWAEELLGIPPPRLLAFVGVRNSAGQPAQGREGDSSALTDVEVRRVLILEAQLRS